MKKSQKAQVLLMAKKGLILEGGAMRGLFTAGVMDVLMENHVTFDGAIGVLPALYSAVITSLSKSAASCATTPDSATIRDMPAFVLC